jgi:magnesium transporter
VLEQLPAEDAAALLADVPARIASGLVARLFPTFAARCLGLLPAERVATLLRRAGAPAVAAILRHAPEPWRAGLLAELPAATAIACRLLLRYPEDALGALVDVDVPTFPAEASVREALARLKARGDEAGDYLYVLDAERRLRACIRLRTLLHQGSSLALGAVPGVELPTLPAKATAASVVEHEGWSAHSTLPVVDRDRRFVGALRQAALAQAIARLRPPAPVSQEGAMEILGQSYWGAFSALLEAAVGLLPGRARGSGR